MMKNSTQESMERITENVDVVIVRCGWERRGEVEHAETASTLHLDLERVNLRVPKLRPQIPQLKVSRLRKINVHSVEWCFIGTFPVLPPALPKAPGTIWQIRDGEYYRPARNSPTAPSPDPQL